MVLLLESLLVIFILHYVIKSLYSSFTLSYLWWGIIFTLSILIVPAVLKLVIVVIGLVFLFVQITRKKRVDNRAYEIGKAGAQGKNIYLTFGSAKTVCKDADDSYKRYAMAMNQYEQELCDKEEFVKGYNDTKQSE